MSKSVNGWPVIQNGSSTLHKWVIPGADRTLVLRNGSAGFLLAHMALFFHENIERLDLGPWDEWGHNVRAIAGTSVFSNHSSGTAIDLNATRHPYHVPTDKTFTKKQQRAIRRRLKMYRSVMDWGGDWSAKWVDGMHFEIVGSLSACERVARFLSYATPRGRRIIAANPSQRAVIFS